MVPSPALARRQRLLSQQESWVLWLGFFPLKYFSSPLQKHLSRMGKGFLLILQSADNAYLSDPSRQHFHGTSHP